ncbi:MAG: hypothetical protein ACXADY_20095 [Candidatus Hodarchaeales archaeon]|jgi:hypothetical protein
MIGLEITSKESGIPLFTHEFRPNTLLDGEIRGGLISAIMQVMGETFGQQETKIVNYGQYNAILTEGEYVYGVLFTFQTGPIIEKFCRGLVETFENKYLTKLETLMSPDTLIESSEYTDFSNECIEAYNSLLHIDETKLSKLLEIVHSYHDRIFENMIIFLRPEMSQIYTHLASERFSVFSNEVSTAIKTLLDLSTRTTFPIENFQISLSKDFLCLMFNIFPYTVVIFVDEDNLDTTQWRIKEIIKSFVEG